VPQGFDAQKQALYDQDSEYRAKVDAVEKARKERAEALQVAAAPILADLHDVGIDVSSLWDLVARTDPYPAALPILMHHLERGGYPDQVEEALGRSLAVKPAIQFWDRLRELYRAPRNRGEETGVALALAASATVKQLDDLVSFITDTKRGDNRVFFVRPVLRLGGDRGPKVIAALVDDPVVGKEARALYRK